MKNISLVFSGLLLALFITGCQPAAKKRNPNGNKPVQQAQDPAEQDPDLKKPKTMYGRALNKAKKLEKKVDQYNSRLEDLMKPGQR